MSRRGWTLIEMLIGLAIFAIMAVAVYTSLQLGVSVSRRMDFATASSQEVRVLMDRMTTDLRNSFPSVGIPGSLWAPFQGEKERMTFPTQLAGVTETFQNRWQIVMVRYGLEEGKLKRWISTDFIKTAESESWSEPQIWLEDVEELSFGYAALGDSTGEKSILLPWPNSWWIDPSGKEAKEVLPQAILIDMKIRGEKIHSQIFIPRGKLTAEKPPDGSGDEGGEGDEE